MIPKIAAKWKSIPIFFFLFLLLIVCIVVSSLRVVCDNPTEVWAIKPRTTIDNVILYTADNSDVFNFRGKYTDVSGKEWYMVSGVLDYNGSAGLDTGFILAESCHWEIFCFNSR